MKQYKKRREFLKKALYKAPTIVLLGQLFDASTLQAASRGGGSRGGGSRGGGSRGGGSRGGGSRGGGSTTGSLFGI